MTGSLSRHTALLAGIAVAMTWQPGRIPLPARGLCAAAIVVAVTLWGQGAGLRPRLLLVDVGQGEAWVLFWQEETWVIDVGPVPGTEGRASRCLVPVLRSSGRLRIDRLILTHDDMDHTGGLGELSAAGIPVRFIHHPRNWTVGPATSAWISRAAHAGTQVIPLARGDTLRAAEGRLAVLHPPPQGIASGGGGEKNAECLAFHIAVLGMNGIVCADSPQGVIEGWIAEGLVGPSDFISAAHHGSAGSASSLFLARAQPRVALISVARDNRFGLPDRLTLATLDERGIAILRTDRDGTVVIARCGAGWAASGYASGRRVVMVAERRAAQAARGF